MKHKSIISLVIAAILIFSISIIGCGNTPRTRIGNDAGNNFFNNNATGDGDNTGNNITDTQDNTDDINRGINNASEATKDRIESTADSIRYGAENFRNDITNAGYKLSESADNNRDYFNGRETDYLLGGDVVRLYEYNSAADLEGDITRIAPDGMTINGTNANYTTRPYYYRKGNTLVVYEGKEPAYLDEFGRIFGNTLRP